MNYFWQPHTGIVAESLFLLIDGVKIYIMYMYYFSFRSYGKSIPSLVNCITITSCNRFQNFLLPNFICTAPIWSSTGSILIYLCYICKRMLKSVGHNFYTPFLSLWDHQVLGNMLLHAVVCKHYSISSSFLVFGTFVCWSDDCTEIISVIFNIVLQWKSRCS